MEIKPMIFDIEQLKIKASQKDKLAHYLIARSYDSEENGLPKDLKKAVEWYTKGYLLDDAKCTYGLGACYYFGDGVNKDEKQAYQLFIKAYKNLLQEIEETKENKKIQAFSKFCLGAYYYFGFGDVQKDERMAFQLIYECAQEGHIAAIYDLGANFFYYGVGTEKNLELSQYYLQMAANTGLPRALKKLKEYQYEYENIRR